MSPGSEVAPDRLTEARPNSTKRRKSGGRKEKNKDKMHSVGLDFLSVGI